MVTVAPNVTFEHTGRGTECRLDGETFATIVYQGCRHYEVWPSDEMRSEFGDVFRVCLGALAARMYASMLACELVEWRGPGYAAASAQGAPAETAAAPAERQP